MLQQEPGGEEQNPQTDLYSQVKSPLEGVFSVFPVLVKNLRWADGGCCHVTLQEAALCSADLRSKLLGPGQAAVGAPCILSGQAQQSLWPRNGASRRPEALSA